MTSTQAAGLILSARASKTAYERGVQRADLDNAIRDYEALLVELTNGHPDFPLHANALCQLYDFLAIHIGNPAYHRQALDLALKTLHDTCSDSVYRVDCLYSVGYACMRVIDSEHRSEMGMVGLRHLDEAIRSASIHHPKMARILSARAMILYELAIRSIGEERTERALESIRTHDAALAHAASDDDRAYVLRCHSKTLIWLACNLPHDLDRLEDGISLAEECLRLTQPADYRNLSPLSNLALGHYILWKRNRSSGLNEVRLAQQYLQSAANLLPTDHQFRCGLQLNEAEMRLEVFNIYGAVQALEAGLETFRTLMDTLPRDHPHFYDRASTLGTALFSAFQNRGLSYLLDESIEWLDLAVQHAPQHERWRCRQQLGKVLLERYVHQRDLRALESAIAMLEQGENEAALPHEGRQVFVPLGNALTARYLAWGRTEDFDRAVKYLQQMTELSPREDSVDLGAARAAYGQAMLARYQQTGSVSTLHAASESFNAAVACVRASRSSLATYCHDLGHVERLLYVATGCSLHLETSMDAFQTSLRSIAEDHPLMAAGRYELALCRIARYESGNYSGDFTEASDLLESAYMHEQSFVTHRWLAAKERARLLHLDDPGAALESYKMAISLLPRLAWLGLEEQTRYETAQSWLSLGNDAAACALTQSNLELAVELLESSRSILWNQQVQLGEVSQPGPSAMPVKPELLAELQSIGRALEASVGDFGLETFFPSDTDEAKRLEQASRARRRLAERWDELVAQVRAHPGAQNFLGRSEYFELQRATVFGPVVLLNINEYRSDGIIVSADSPPRTFPLPNASPEVINLHAGHLIRALSQAKDYYGFAFAEGQVYQLLQALWTAVAEDICLAMQPLLPEGRLSRVWLMPTGALAALPLHAALSGGPESVGLMDVMIPSYTPTLSALIRAQQQLSRDGQIRSKILAVGCSKIAGASPLPSWLDEKDVLVDNFPAENLTILEDDDATSEHVLQHLPNHNFIHITSHGHHDWINPYHSHIALHDGPLTLRKLAQQKLDHADFAFLSACHTARIDPRAPDESINLASGLNVAGFRSIIGTMWGIADCDAGDAAEAVYSHLTRDGRTPDPTEAAEALHEAVQRMRYSGLPVIRWAPFIHIGI